MKRLDTCEECSREIDSALARLGSLTCADCRKHPHTILLAAPAAHLDDKAA